MGTTARWLATVCLAALAVACGDDDDPPPIGRGIVSSVSVVASGGDFRGAIDATLSPPGLDVYFTAGSARGPGVFSVPAAGGPVRTVATGDPFRAPVGIASETEGGRLFVADPEAAGTTGGAVVVVPFNPAPRAVLPGTEGTRPRGLEVVREGAADVVYLAGRDPADGTAGVFRVPASGGPLTTVAKGAPLVAPDAVTVTKAGDVYVSDRGPATDGSQGAVLRIRRGTVEKIADLRAPVLAGITLTLDESTLLVSSLSRSGTDQVLLVDLASGRTSTFAETIGENRDGGGLHRARDVDVFAWADLAAGPDRASRVYVLRP